MVLVAVLLLCGIGVYAWRTFFVAPANGMFALRNAAALERHRSVEPRLSGGFDYRPFHIPTQPTYTASFARAAGDVLYIMRRQPTGESLHAGGVLYLIAGRHDDAITTLERSLGLRAGESRGAVIRRTNNAALLLDFSAACYERAIRNQRVLDLTVAYEASARAIELVPVQPEPRFVHALVLEALHLPEEAAAGWKAYIQRDASSAWSGEAKRHLLRLQLATKRPDENAIARATTGMGSRTLHELVAASPRESRTLAEEKLLGTWGDAILDGREEVAAGALARAKSIGQALLENRLDGTVADCVRLIELASARSDAKVIRDLAIAHAAYRDARLAFSKARDEASRNAIESAARLLDRVESPLAFRAHIYAATIFHYQGRNDAALQRLHKTIESIGSYSTRYPVATGQAYWTRGLVEFALGLPYRSLRSYEIAGQHLAHATETSNIAGVETVMVETYRYLGDAENAWLHQLRALQALNVDGTYTRRQIAASEAAMAALDLGLPRLAQLFTERMARIAAAQRDPIFAAQAAVTRAQIFSLLQQRQQAAHATEEAAAILDRNPASPSTARLIADVAIMRAEATMTRDPGAAIALLNTTTARLRMLDHSSRLPHIHLLLSQAHRCRGASSAAEQALIDGIRIFERQRDRIGTDLQRTTFTDTGRALYDALIRAFVDRRKTDEALLMARRARAMGVTFPDRSSHLDVHGFTQPSTREALIEYYILPSSLLIWITSGGRTTLVEQRIDSAQFVSSMERVSDAIADARDLVGCKAQASSAFEILLRPVAEALRAEQPLLIAPDGVLHLIPFGALFDSESQTFVVERHPVTILLGAQTSDEPGRRLSSGRYRPVTTAGGRRRYTEAPGPYRSILAVASPESAELPVLTRVRTEARRVASLFPRALVLDERQATPKRILSELDRFDIFHYGGHAVWNERQPQLAALRLAPSIDSPDGTLRAFEIDGRTFRSTKLVVLAACDTARGRVAGSGLLSFTRTLIAGGVAHVVGSLWPAGDETSAVLFMAFYKELAHGSGPAEALRAAQIAAIESTEHSAPSNWAAFQLYAGGHMSNGIPDPGPSL